MGLHPCPSPILLWHPDPRRSPAHPGGLFHTLPQGLQLRVILLLQPVHLPVVAGNLLLQGSLQGGEFSLPLSQMVLLLLFGDEQVLKILF